MVCDILIRRLLGLSAGEQVPSDVELQAMVGADNHEEFHTIVQSLSKEELEELRKKIAKWRKKKFGITTDYVETAPVS